MIFVKSLLRFLVKAFFGIYFSLFGKPKFSPLVKKTLKLYESDDFYKLFSFVRFWDAPFEEINKIVPKKGVILDLGCGDGIISNYLALSSKLRRVVGIELDKQRFKEAKKGISNTRFLRGNIVKKQFPKVDVILLVHVLHHLSSYQDQEIVLQKCKKSLAKNGKLIIVEIVEKPVLKYWFTWLTDSITVPILFENKIFTNEVYFREIRDWEKLLRENDLEFKVKSVHKGKPFSHIAFICQNK